MQSTTATRLPAQPVIRSRVRDSGPRRSGVARSRLAACARVAGRSCSARSRFAACARCASCAHAAIPGARLTTCCTRRAARRASLSRGTRSSGFALRAAIGVAQQHELAVRARVAPRVAAALAAPRGLHRADEIAAARCVGLHPRLRTVGDHAPPCAALSCLTAQRGARARRPRPGACPCAARSPRRRVGLGVLSFGSAGAEEAARHHDRGERRCERAPGAGCGG